MNNVNLVSMGDNNYTRVLIDEYAILSFYCKVLLYPLTAPGMALFFQPESIDIFVISLQKHMLWVLIRSASARRF